MVSLTVASPQDFRSGFVALLGVPNVGKSTLLNALLKFRLSIVSPSPQTTRHRILGILNGDGHQICFLDTPGLLARAEDGLQDVLIQATRAAVRRDADLIVALVEPAPPAPEILARIAKAAEAGKPVLLAVNKSDAAGEESLKKTAAVYETALPVAGTHFISARTGAGVPALKEDIIRRLPASPAYYGTDQLSDRWERFFVSEIIRQVLFELYRAEVPHACAVSIEDFKEIKGRPDKISAVIYIERATQKAILLGKKGRSLRKLSAKCRAAVSAFLGRKADLQLWIKVRAGWRKDKRALKELGYMP